MPSKSTIFYETLAIEFRIWLSEWSQLYRHQLTPHQSTENFWDQLTHFNQKSILDQYAQYLQEKKDPIKINIENFVNMSTLGSKEEPFIKKK